jgi:hypothetical protein
MDHLPHHWEDEGVDDREDDVLGTEVSPSSFLCCMRINPTVWYPICANATGAIMTTRNCERLLDEWHERHR